METSILNHSDSKLIAENWHNTHLLQNFINQRFEIKLLQFFTIGCRFVLGKKLSDGE